MFHNILFPVDFSDRCKQVVPLIRALANRNRANVTLMHVIPIPIGCYGGIEGATPTIFDLDMTLGIRERLAEFYMADDAELHHKVDTVVTQGNPGAAIVRHASEASIDLIAMPTHGYGTFRRLLLGSVTAQVLHDALCPVWTAAHAEDPELRTHAECRSVMCAVDSTEKSIPVIRRAAHVAGELAASLRLVYAVPLLLSAEVPAPSDEETGFLAAARKQIENLQFEAGTKLGVCLARGNVSDVVREAALHHSADLIVIGRGRIQERFGGLRSNAYAIIRDSPCPVLSV